MNTGTKLLITGVAVAATVAIAVWAVDVDVSGDVELPAISTDFDVTEGSLPNVDINVTGETRLPDVDANVDMRGGEMPRVDINTVDVNMREKTMKVDVPTDVKVVTEQRTVSYPVIDIDKPEEDTMAEENDLK